MVLLDVQGPVSIGVEQIIGRSNLWLYPHHVKLTLDAVFVNRAPIRLQNRHVWLNRLAGIGWRRELGCFELGFGQGRDGQGRGAQEGGSQYPFHRI